ncbi:UNVERIFIED_ORG: hypothetical protein GGI63_004534, partial [Rhizobium esperanzae]
VKLNNRLLESQAVFGHAKPPKVDVQLSGVSSFTKPGFFIYILYFGGVPLSESTSPTR